MRSQLVRFWWPHLNVNMMNKLITNIFLSISMPMFHSKIQHNLGPINIYNLIKPLYDVQYSWVYSRSVTYHVPFS